MKKTIFILLLNIFVAKIFACGGGWSDDDYYYNLFSQEIIKDPQYFPFLLTLDYQYYPTEIKNENIEEWQQYLQLSYEDAYYLVFKATREDVQNLTKGQPVSDPKLQFATPQFAQKHKQALLYLAYAKYLEPYMTISNAPDNDNEWSWYWYYKSENTADKLDYAKVMNVLQKSWNAETDKELKLRYGYQMVRFAHYNRKYEEAVSLFNNYVESLQYRPAMYYHALAQKAGALKGLGDYIEGNADFFQVFVHSKNLKEMALNSIDLGNSTEYEYFLENAKTDQERNDAYLLLGYGSFNNPLNEIEKITQTTPDAIQAKVLMARAINQIEREIMPIYYYSWDYENRVLSAKDKRYPFIEATNIENFFNQTLEIANNMAASEHVKDKNFWHITNAYLSFLNKDFAKAKNQLQKVNATDSIYTAQKENLALLIPDFDTGTPKNNPSSLESHI